MTAIEEDTYASAYASSFDARLSKIEGTLAQIVYVLQSLTTTIGRLDDKVTETTTVVTDIVSQVEPVVTELLPQAQDAWAKAQRHPMLRSLFKKG